MVTRNQSATVKTLHTVLRTNVVVSKLGHSHQIVFVNDTAGEKAQALNKHLKNCDKLLWLDYTVAVDSVSIEKGLSSQTSVLYPAVIPNVDWDLFKDKVLGGSKEPNYQMGMKFDVDVDKATQDNTMWTVKSAKPKVFMLDTKDVLKALRNKKSENSKLTADPEVDFFNLKNRNMKFLAFIEAEVMLTNTYECLGNILNAAGIKSR